MKEIQGKLPEIRHHLVMDAPIQKVWEAVATSDGLAAWFMPNDFKAALGHEFHLNAGPYGMSPCKVIELDPPHRLTFKWGKDWSLTFVLEETDDDKTDFTLIHWGWDPNKVTEFNEAHTIVRKRMDNGWAKLVKKLDAYVRS
ncbi:SRPBCC domain-containing protein [Camelliibacillus cellulosilyticus]|uniref:SRPBCC domain-containing protein n=1 Tax=Camelliibacillus cellulosilyticus TaxID=2174486 RepID=A0ABV9GK90_9BACL